MFQKFIARFPFSGLMRILNYYSECYSIHFKTLSASSFDVYN